MDARKESIKESIGNLIGFIRKFYQIYLQNRLRNGSEMEPFEKLRIDAENTLLEHFHGKHVEIKLIAKSKKTLPIENQTSKTNKHTAADMRALRIRISMNS